jgi:hypothetical protein
MAASRQLRAALAWHQGGYGRVLDSRTVPGRAHRR